MRTFKEFWDDDRAESSIMQVIAIMVSAISAASMAGFVGVLFTATAVVGGEQDAQIKAITASAFFEREGSDAHSVQLATPNKTTFTEGDGTCVSYSLEPGSTSKKGVDLIRYENDCAGSKFLPTHKTLLTGMGTSSTIEYKNVAGLDIVNGVPQGTCDDYFLPAECSSTVPHIIEIHADTVNPVTNSHALTFAAVTDIELHQMSVDGDRNVEVTNSDNGTTAPATTAPATTAP
jgi:hypothetical protein